MEKKEIYGNRCGSNNAFTTKAMLFQSMYRVEMAEAGECFNVIASTLYEHYDEVLNFFNNRSTNAFAESFNAKIKQFRAQLRGVIDIKFFFFRLVKLYA